MVKDNPLVLLDSADKVPPVAATPPHQIISYPRDTPRPRGPQLPPQAWILLTVAALLPVVAALVAFWQFVAARPWLGEALGFAGAAVVLLAAVGLVVGLYDTLRARRDRLAAEALQAAVLRTRLGNAAHVATLPRTLDQVLTLETAAIGFELQRAPYTQHPVLSTMSMSNTAPPAIATPESGLQLVPDGEWLGWLVEQPHTMIAGATKSGKTTLARIALHERLQAGASALVVDPKGKDWDGLPVVGGGRAFAEILGALDAVRQEMAARFVAYNQGERAFEPLVVLVDEVPDIMESCYDDRGKLVDLRWRRFIRSLGSLAREVHISVVMLTQSPLVEDIGMNSAMRKNYTRLALGDEALPLIRSEEPDPKRKAQLVDLLRGQRYPAALYRAGAVELLDTANVLTLAARPLTPRGWSPPSGLWSVPPTELLVQTEQTDQTADRGQQDAAAYKEALIVGLKRRGKGRAAIRQELSELGLGFDNAEYTEILSRHGLS